MMKIRTATTRANALIVGGWIAIFSALSAAAEEAVVTRIAARTFPSVFQAWNPADNLKEPREQTEARHDLIFHGERFFGLRWDHAHPVSDSRVRLKQLLCFSGELIILFFCCKFITFINITFNFFHRNRTI